MAFMDPSNPNYYVATDKDRTTSQDAKKALVDSSGPAAAQRKAAFDARTSIGGSSGGVTYVDAGGYPISIDPKLAEAQIAKQNAAKDQAARDERGTSQAAPMFATPVNPFAGKPAISGQPASLGATTQTVVTSTSPGNAQEINVPKNVYVTTSKDFAGVSGAGTSQMVQTPGGVGYMPAGEALKYAPINFESTRQNAPMRISEGILSGVSFGAFGLTKLSVKTARALTAAPTEDSTRQSIAMNAEGVTAVRLPKDVTIRTGTPIGDFLEMSTSLAAGAALGKLQSATGEYLLGKETVKGPTTQINIKSASRYNVGSKEMESVNGEYVTTGPKEFGTGEFRKVGPTGNPAQSVELSGVRIDIKPPTMSDKVRGLLSGKPAEESISSTYIMGKSFPVVEQEGAAGLGNAFGIAPVETAPNVLPFSGQASRDISAGGNNIKEIGAFSGGNTEGLGLSSYYGFSNKGIRFSYGSDFAAITEKVPVVSVDVPVETHVVLPADAKGNFFVEGRAGDVFKTTDALQLERGSKTALSANNYATINEVALTKPLASGMGGKVNSLPSTSGFTDVLAGLGDTGFSNGPNFGIDLGAAQASAAGLGSVGSSYGYDSGIMESPIYLRPEAQPGNVNQNLSNISQTESFQSSNAGLSGFGLQGSVVQGSALGGQSQIGLQSQLQTQTGLQSQIGLQSQLQTQTQLSTRLSTGFSIGRAAGIESQLSTPTIGETFDNKAFNKRQLMFSPRSGGRGKAKSYGLPTADLFSIDRTFRKFGTVKFTASKAGRAAFAKAAGNPLANFPTAQEFKGGFRL